MIDLSESIKTGGNYTDPDQTGEGSKFSRVGDQSDTPATNEVTESNTAAKLANLLEGISFPASKEEIKSHLNRQSPTMGNRINDVLERIQNRLEDGRKYENAYEIELATGLVRNND